MIVFVLLNGGSLVKLAQALNGSQDVSMPVSGSLLYERMEGLTLGKEEYTIVPDDFPTVLNAVRFLPDEEEGVNLGIDDV